MEEHALAFEPLPEDTLAPGATLVIPRNHREGLLGPSESELASVMDLVRRVAAAMRSGLGSTGTFLIQAADRTRAGRSMGSEPDSARNQRPRFVSVAKTAAATVPYTRCADRSSRSVRAS